MPDQIDSADVAELRADGLQAAEQEDFERASELLQRALRGSVDPELINDLAVVSYGRGAVGDAEALLRTCLIVDPEHAEAHQNLAAVSGGAAGPAQWRSSPTLGGPDQAMPERAFPGMPHWDVMAEHSARYSFALQHAGGKHVLDLGCGTGYGSEMLSWVAASVRGFDLWEPDAAERPLWPGGAQLTYGHDLCQERLPQADVAVMFEVIEHLADAPAALRTVWGSVDTIVGSFPNPRWHGSHHNPFHVNDWPLEEFEQHLRETAGGRAARVTIRHMSQTGGLLREVRDPEASYWVVVASII